MIKDVSPKQSARELSALVSAREDFVAFVGVLANELRCNPDAWENNRVETYLDALGAWVQDMDGYYANRREEVPREPTWRLLATIMVAATMYE